MGNPFNDQDQDQAVAVVKNRIGLSVPFTQRDLDQVQILCSTGHSARYIAYQLGLDEREFKKLVKHSHAVQEAIKLGLARDEQEMTSKLRELGIKGDRKAINDYLEHRHGKQKGYQGITVQINTGVERGQTIEHKG